jgi:hypothetical protein
MVDEKIVKKELLDKEQGFINAQSKNNWAAYSNFITAETRIYRPRSVPFITKEQRNTKTLNGNYLRIWKRSDGTDWKLVLDIVNIAS